MVQRERTKQSTNTTSKGTQVDFLPLEALGREYLEEETRIRRRIAALRAQLAAFGDDRAADPPKPAANPSGLAAKASDFAAAEEEGRKSLERRLYYLRREAVDCHRTGVYLIEYYGGDGPCAI